MTATTLTGKSSGSSLYLPQIAAARSHWQNHQARPEQLPPTSDWTTWLYLAGRGAGKTRTAAEWLAYKAVTQPKTRWAIVAPTFGDGRDTCVEGESGLLAILNRYEQVASWNRSQGAIRTRNGSLIRIFSGEEPERLRGPQHHGAWVDELAAFRYMRETWDQLRFGLRLGEHPQIVVTTTPKPNPLIRELVARDDGTISVTRGSTFDNAKNLAPAALAEFLSRYEGTRLGRQELYGELIEEAEGALWSMNLIEQHRVQQVTEKVLRRVVSVDPAVTANETSDETGIIVCSRDGNGHAYVEADYSMRGTPNEWAHRTIAAYEQHECDAVVVEVNQGGDMVAATLRTIKPNLPIKEVRASKGKRLRAEPVSSMYEQGKIHHVGGFPALENQMTTWTPDDPKSPDRLDALVHGLTELMEGNRAQAYLRAIAVVCSCGYPNTRGSTICVHCGLELKAV